MPNDSAVPTINALLAGATRGCSKSPCRTPDNAAAAVFGAALSHAETCGSAAQASTRMFFLKNKWGGLFIAFGAVLKEDLSSLAK
ncbi:MAG: hypothetical protein U0987_17965 [Afipia sp.]|nr:hypothetical protein [Afipia sp.]